MSCSYLLWCSKLYFRNILRCVGSFIGYWIASTLVGYASLGFVFLLEEKQLLIEECFGCKEELLLIRIIFKSKSSLPLILPMKPCLSFWTEKEVLLCLPKFCLNLFVDYYLWQIQKNLHRASSLASSFWPQLPSF